MFIYYATLHTFHFNPKFPCRYIKIRNTRAYALHLQPRRRGDAADASVGDSKYANTIKRLTKPFDKLTLLFMFCWDTICHGSLFQNGGSINHSSHWFAT